MTDAISRRRFNKLGAASAGLGLAGCATPDPLEGDLPDMGDFNLGFAIVVSKNARKIPPSRDATPEAWKAVMTSELERRFGQYGGPKSYHIAVNIDGYALAPPGVPIVLTPKSILVVSANIWTADPQEKIGGPEQISTFEGADTLLLGSGLVKTAEEQMETLARNMAGKIQSWMRRNPTWFGLPER
ncbi:MAG: hypothetical protein AAFY65_12070 [Pseudomonadota bacterium]